MVNHKIICSLSKNTFYDRLIVVFLTFICKKKSVITRYFIFLSYRGTSYHGWQIQPNGITVQEILDKALSVILKEKINTTGAGRTDTGVHAQVFCAHFDSGSSDLDEKKNFIYKLNVYLPPDISANSIRKVRGESNARFSALSRTYIYYISRKKDPFTDDSSWFIHGDIDLDSMNRAAAALLEHTDFTSFSRLHSEVKTNNCRIMRAEWTVNGNQLVFTIQADRFLRNMVRAIVGTMASVGSGKISVEGFNTIIMAKDRGKAGKSAPAKGLFLTGIEYPENIFI